MALLTKLREARAELEAQGRDPWAAKLEGVLSGVEAVSTAALIDILCAPANTATARRLATVMRALHFIPIKSRRLMPGGRAGNTVTRGWARPVRSIKSSPTICNAGAIAPQSRGCSHAI